MQDDSKVVTSGQPDSGFIKFEDMDRQENVVEPLDRDEREPPVLSQVFAVDQLKRGAENAANLFSWGLSQVKETANQVSESEQVQQVLESTRPQRESINANLSQLWESTKPQREEMAKAASNLSQQVQPTLDKLKMEGMKAFDSFSNSTGASNYPQRSDDSRE